jgi:50S ribosomal protein L16 3-hydroxylase
MVRPSTVTLLGGISAARFMRHHWQRRPLLVRQAWPGVAPPLGRAALFALAGSDDVESRLVRREPGRWIVRHGPLRRRQLPALAQPDWTVLVQGVDLHDATAHRMLRTFDFVPAARLDDLMISWASDGGGVGPHVDSYDVFLLQLEGRRRWRVGRVSDAATVEGAPLKILRRFECEHDWLLAPGDMLYLPPLWGHDGVAVGPCMTASIGFRAPRAGTLAAELAWRIGEAVAARGALYRDAGQRATATPAAIPAAMQRFAAFALRRALADSALGRRALGEALTEPKPKVWFRPAAAGAASRDRVWRPAPGTRMLYDEEHLYVNGDSYRMSGADVLLLRRLADSGHIDGAARARLSGAARGLLQEWLQQGWLMIEEDVR